MNIILSIVGIAVIAGGFLWWGMGDKIGSSPDSTSSYGKLSSTSSAQNTSSATPQRADTGGSSLDASGKGLTAVPAGTFEMTALTTLDLSDNALGGSLPGEVRFLQNLTVLDLSGNQFTGVPAEIGQLQNLKVLDLSNNKLTGLPGELGNLKNLTRLDISGNAYSESDLANIKKGLSANVVIVTE